MRTILVSGTSGGLGRYLHESLKESLPLNRSTSPEELRKLTEEGVETIIHCAYNPQKNVVLESTEGYMKDTVFLTKTLLSIPHKRFIFISTVDVYPYSTEPHLESESLQINNAKDIYALTKMMCESMVLNDKNSLVLRCSALLGPYMRKNSLLRILEDIDCSLTLSSESQFNYVLYSNIKDVVDVAISKELNGIYNVVSSQNITLAQIADKFKKKVKFGSFVYDVGKINNDKICKIYAPLGATSEDIIRDFLKTKP